MIPEQARRDYSFSLCIGLTQLTQSYLINSENVPRCEAYDCDLTQEHILFECGYCAVRQRYYDAENLGQRFQKINGTYVFHFLWKQDCFIEYMYCLYMIACEWNDNILVLLIGAVLYNPLRVSQTSSHTQSSYQMLEK